jgi:hypothetical protein
MDEYQDQDSTDETDTEESPVLTELRNQNRRLEKDNAKLQALQAEVEVAAQTQRAETAKEIVNTLGLPGLVEDVLQWVQGDITQEAVIGALTTRSIPLPEGTVEQKPEDDQTPSASSVGQIVADTAAGKDGRSLEERISSAETPAELEALMEEAELVRSHF